MTSSQRDSAMNDYWNDDFAPLEAAGKAVLTALRNDEAAPDADLYRRIVSSGSGSHLYFPSDPKQHPSATMSHIRSIPLPLYLSQQLQTTRVSSLMGLLPEADLVWMSVDEKLYLWSSSSAGVPGGMEDFCSFTVPTGQCVVSVGLVKPKKGVFKEVVEWCLIVSTPEEVILCALARTVPQTMHNGENGFVHGQGTLRLIPTRYVLPTDSIPILSVCGTPDGRIFLGGYDGCLYEMTYDSVVEKPHPASSDEKLNAFYNGDKPLPSSQTNGDSVVHTLTKFGKRALSSVVPSSSDPSKLPRKCRKLNHSTHASSVVSAIIPSFIVKAASAVTFSGDTSAGGPIVKIIVDSERSCMYTLTSRGWISAFDLRPNGKSNEIKFMSTIDMEKTARLYLEAVSRGRMYPPSSSHSATIGNITFPGGGSSAQAGVGGMDGARTLLKLADSGPKHNAGRQRRLQHSQSAGILTPVSIHVISRRESGRLTLMAITDGGLRYYLSSLSTNVLNRGPGQQTGPGNPLAPSRKFTLCHVRTSPPIDDSGILHGTTSFDANDEVEGYVPGFGSRGGRVPHVDAGFYGNGTMVLALEQTASQNGSMTNGGRRFEKGSFVGDSIVATEPDAIARKKSTPQTNGTDAQQRQLQPTVMTAPGGITETVALPLAAPASLTTDVAPVLPGGRILDIASLPSSSSVLTLMFHSQTPTDSELKVGLVPPYIPPSRLKSYGTQQTNRPPITSPLAAANTSGSRSIVTTNSGGGSGSVALTILSNFLLSRPLRQGLTIERPLPQLGSSDASSTNAGSSYRLSTRYGYAGFSTTAADTISRDKSNRRPIARSGSKSARLSPWLLRPGVAALDQFSVQHLIPSTTIAALNSGGMHFFSNKTILTNLAETLISASVNVGSDESVSRFFTSYGYAQGCSMCLSLAVGCGPAADTEQYSSDLRNRARRAALSRAHLPRLVKKQEQPAGTVTTDITVPDTNDLAPPGYEFHPSSLSQGLTTLLSRLLRPVWYKPAVVVTEGQTLRGRSLPAKVELLLDDQTLTEIRQPLYSLQMLMREVFSPAINVVPGLQRQDTDRMEVEEENTYTNAMRYHGYVRGQAEQALRNTLTPREAETMARLIEERNLHSLYRLVSRSVQLLSLLALLKRAQYLPELQGVEWGLLHGLTIAQLVEKRECQERLEHLLSSLVGAGSSSPAMNISPSTESQELAQLLSSECYLYFSPASHYAYMGFRSANEALSCAPSSRRVALANQAAEYFKRASGYWYNAPLITGRILHGNANESYEQIALRAMRFDSPLAKASDALYQLNDVVSIVDVCLTTASNFGGRSTKPALPASPGINANSNPDLLPWERMLYHKRRPSENENHPQSNGSSSSTTSPTQVVGAAVTSKDALSTCYALIFHYLSMLLNSQNTELARKMIDACAKSPDKEFLHTLYEYLIRTKHFGALLQIQSPDLERWLRGPDKDVELIWQYYREQGNDAKAGEVMRKHACEQNPNLDLDTRINYLRKALSSYTVALQKRTDVGQAYSGWNQPAVSDADREELQAIYTEVREALDVAVLQSRILRTVESSSLESKLDESQMTRLKSTLILVSDLYNDYAAPLNLLDVCLLILHSCRHNDVEAIRNLWQNIICEEIFPCATRSPDAYRYLQSLMSGSVVDESVRLVPEGGTSKFPFFEDGDWVVPLSYRIISLGKEVYGNGADYVFPVEFLASKLEGLRHELDLAKSPAGRALSLSARGRSWPLQILIDVGVPFLTCFEAYEDMAGREERELMGRIEEQRRLFHISMSVDLLWAWVAAASESPRIDGTENYALKELTRAVSSGTLLSRIDAFKASLEGLNSLNLEDSRAILDRLSTIEDAIRRIA